MPDQTKIGAFIAERRRMAGLSQAQLDVIICLNTAN